MKESRTVLVIGAGIGGLATSVYLARAGYDVTVIEKNNVPGGRCGQLIHEGHRFDLGATMVLMPGVYREVFSDLGIDFDEELNIRELEHLYRLWFDDGSGLTFSTDRTKLSEQLESFEKGSSAKAEKYITEGYGFYEEAKGKLIGRNFLNFFQFATPANMAMLVKLKTYLTHQQYIQRFFKNDHLQMAFTFQNIYVGQSPFNSPAFFSMIPAIEIKEGSFFPKGGIYSVVENLVRNAEKAGVKILFNAEASLIDTDGKEVTGVRLITGETLRPDIVVANADLPYVYSNLLNDRKKTSNLRKKKYSCSAMVFHWGLDKVYPQLAHHNVFLSDTFRTGLKVIFRDKSADPHPSFYVHAPARTDKSAAPEGCDTLSVIVGIGHVDDSRDQDWQEMKRITKDAVIKRLEEAGQPDVGEHIKFEVCYTPKSWESAYNVTNGSVFGSLNHSLFQMGYFRPHNRHDVLKNMYFTGGSTHPGNGIPLVLLSAKLASSRIISEQNR
ncbi:MAG: phytoene desaturase family protein [Bacteroidales bacterium]